MASTDTANQAILDRLSGMAGFHPASANLFADWTLDPGDVVTVKQGETNYRVPVYQMDIDWKGKSMVSVKSTGSEKRPTLPAMKRSGYGGRAQTQMEREMVIHKADIDKSNEKLSLWATEEEWNSIAGEYQETHRSQFDITARGISSIVTGVDAGNFREDQHYQSGDIVMRYGKLYGFNVDHYGPWDSTHVTQIQDVYGQVQRNTTRIDQDEDSIELVVGTTTSGGKFIKRGNIFAALNEDNTATAGINADKVLITGDTTLYGTMEIDGDGVLRVKKNLIVNGTNGRQVSINNGTISTNDLAVKSGGSLTFVGTATGEHYDITTTNLPDFIRKAEVSGSTLRLWKFTDSDASPSITFNKAVSLSGAWNGSGTYSVSATSGAISGTAPSTTPGLRLNGNGSSSFSAELLSDGSSPAVQKSTPGYLHQSGNSVGVYTSNSGGSYSGLIASIPVSGGGVDPSTAEIVTSSAYESGNDIDVDVEIGVKSTVPGGIDEVWSTDTFTLSNVLEDKTVTLSTSADQVIVPTTQGCVGLASVTVPMVNLKDETFTMNHTTYTVPAAYDGYGTIYVDINGLYTFSCTEQAARWTDSVSGYLSCGSISKSGLTANTYLRFRIKCDDAYKYCYITVNQ